MDKKDRTLYCGNLSENVTEDLLYELFQQAGPLENVSIPKDKEGNKRNFGFITFKHNVSVPYAVALMKGVSLFGKVLRLEFRTGAESGGNPYLEQLIKYQMSVACSANENPYLSSEVMRNSNSNLIQYPAHMGRHRPHDLNGDRFQNHSLTNSASPQNFHHSPNPYGYGNSSPYENSDRSPYSPQSWQPAQNQHYGWNNNSGYSQSRSHQKSNSAPRTKNRY